MARATTRFLNEIKRSHTVISYVDVISPTQETRRLFATDGTVNVDRTAQFRRAATINCVDPLGTFVPNGNFGILTPFGTEVRPYRGVVYSDGTQEVQALGVFTLAKNTIIESSSQSNSVGITMTLEMYDRSRRVSRDKFRTPYVIASGTNLLSAIQLILARTFPNLQYDAISSNMTTTAPQVFDASNDPWQAVTTLATSMGCEIYFDVDGDVVIAPPVDIDALPEPSFTYIENQNCSLTDLQSVFSDDPGFNGVIVTGESVGDELPPVRAESWDTEPTSPTYYLGPYGAVPMFVQDSNVKTVADAQSMADSLLKGQLGFSSQLTITGPTNPAYEAGDVIQVERQKMSITGLYALDSFTVPMKRDGAQQLVVRQKRRVS